MGDGERRCDHCGRPYGLVRGIPRFVDSETYAGNFGFEWQRHRRTQLDVDRDGESERTFREKTGFTPEAIRNRLILDVGCGMGRFAEVTSRWGGSVVAVDLSLAVESAQANLADRPNAVAVQADCFALPFPVETFDVIYSIGVLHHTPDCAAAFRSLVPLLKPGGTIAIWVYGYMGYWSVVASIYRRVTTRIPHPVLHALCQVAVPLYHLHRVPLLGAVTRTVLPTSMHPRAAWRVLDTFDWYSPRYQSMHTREEVCGWFAGVGLTDIRVLDFPVSVRGQKPLRPESSPTS
jgi:SAM-dependent methyltransferase